MDNWEIENALGLSLFASDNLEDAYQAFRRATELDPGKAAPFFNMSAAAKALGRDGEAVALYREYRELCERTCPYRGDLRRGRYESLPLRGLDPEGFDLLLAKGFRRTGFVMSRNVCPDCRDCVQMRIPAATFKPSRSQARALRLASSFRVETRFPPVLDDWRRRLYAVYLRERHGREDQGYSSSDLDEIYSGWRGSVEISVSIGGTPRIFGILDRGKRDLYAALCYYDPDFLDCGPGTVCLLKMLEWGAKEGYRSLYTGEYIESISNMSYKTRFNPREILADGSWTPA